jgi:hypothetical protein
MMKARARDEELPEFPKSDAPVRMLVVFAATLGTAPLALFAAIAASGHQFYTKEYGIAFGILTVVGVSLQSLLTLILLITRAPTRGFACKSLLATFVLLIVSFVVTALHSL